MEKHRSTSNFRNFMNPTNRRQFIQQSAVLAGAVSIAPSLHAAGANDKFILGLIGPGGMGSNHLRAFAGYKDVEVAFVCDPDENRRNAAAREVEKSTGKAPQSVKDMRRVFENQAVDAVVIATPDHWHVPASLLALDAGKHVYVEKPCSHNIREGRLLVDAARRAKRIVQVGTQSRSSEHVRRAMDRLHNGAIGDVLVAKAWNSQLRANIGHAQPADPPSQLDFDLWVGPAPMQPYQPNLLHSSWRWFSNFGCGDAGNDGVHDIDIARWGLGVNAHPNTMIALGGKYFFDDDQQFPDTQYVAFEYALGGKKKTAHLRASHLVALRAGRARERKRVLWHAGPHDFRQAQRLAALRAAQQTHRRNARRDQPRSAPPKFSRLHPERPHAKRGRRDRTPFIGAGAFCKHHDAPGRRFEV
jgi:predicted dehydrogenase